MNRDRCAIRQAGDATWCETCGQEWDTNDSDEPSCPHDPVAKSKNKKATLAICYYISAVFLILGGIGTGETSVIIGGIILAAVAGLYPK